MIKINGIAYECTEISLLQYLNDNNYDIKRIAVEKNGNIVPKSQYADEILHSGDCVEIVSFVGGG